nr:sulfite exporter TauE/SafE family protein [candidate division Zixibacteria bacterium]
MDSFLLGAISAIWLGILTSISPCPLTTNIAAVSFLGKQVSDPKRVFQSGLTYVLGRMLAYLALGLIIIKSLMSIPDLAYFLQQNINQVLGPVLIITGIFLLGIIHVGFPGSGFGRDLDKHISRSGIWGAGLLGIIFALSFCPVSAAIFFGSLIPLSLKHNSSVVIPFLYGLGTGLPVILFAFLISLGSGMVGRIFDKLTRFEKWARRITGIIFILAGIYYTVIYIFGTAL